MGEGGLFQDTKGPMGGPGPGGFSPVGTRGSVRPQRRLATLPIGLNTDMSPANGVSPEHALPSFPPALH